MALPYPTKVVLPFDIATAQDMNERHANDVALANGSGLDDGSVTPEKLGDSGWQTLTLSGGVTGTAEYRKIGTVVYLRGTVTHGGTGWPYSYVTFATLPSDCRPTNTFRTFAGGFAGPTSPTIALHVSNTGDIGGYAQGGTGNFANLYLDQISFVSN